MEYTVKEIKEAIASNSQELKHWENVALTASGVLKEIAVMNLKDLQKHADKLTNMLIQAQA